MSSSHHSQSQCRKTSTCLIKYSHLAIWHRWSHPKTHCLKKDKKRRTLPHNSYNHMQCQTLQRLLNLIQSPMIWPWTILNNMAKYMACKIRTVMQKGLHLNMEALTLKKSLATFTSSRLDRALRLAMLEEQVAQRSIKTLFSFKNSQILQVFQMQWNHLKAGENGSLQ